MHGYSEVILIFPGNFLLPVELYFAGYFYSVLKSHSVFFRLQNVKINVITTPKVQFNQDITRQLLIKTDCSNCLVQLYSTIELIKPNRPVKFDWIQQSLITEQFHQLRSVYYGFGLPIQDQATASDITVSACMRF